MRRATCVSLTSEVTVHGSLGSVTICGPIGREGEPGYVPGWTGDLDQVIGRTDAGPCTIADALGPGLLPHFTIEDAPARRGRPTAEKPAPPAEET